MRSILLVFFLISTLTSAGYAKTQEAHAVADTAHTTIITMNGIGDIKVGMKINDLSKLLNKPVRLKNLLSDQIDRDTINVSYKEVAMQVVIGKMYLDNDKTENVVWEVKSSSPQIKIYPRQLFYKRQVLFGDRNHTCISALCIRYFSGYQFITGCYNL